MNYLTYMEYTQYGGKAEESSFTALERKARKKLDYFTQERLVNETVIPDSVKECMTELIDTLKENEGEEVSSFSNGNVSVTFKTDEKTLEDKLWDIAVTYLPIELITMAVDI